MSESLPIVMTKEAWMNPHLSVARLTGGITVNGYKYIIVNKEGKDLMQCSYEARKEGRSKAIEPGEPADMVRYDFLEYYKKLGREKFIGILKENSHAGSKTLETLLREAMANMK